MPSTFFANMKYHASKGPLGAKMESEDTEKSNTVQRCELLSLCIVLFKYECQK